MGYAVLHLEKAKGADTGMSAHIERTIHPKNADESRTHLNKELIEFPDGIHSRSEAISYRINTAGITRKIGKNQVRAIRVLLTGTYEDMKRIEDRGQLNSWYQDNMQWLQETYGKENVVSAVLHMDEHTPHIHATIVPIVTCERRKAKKEEENGKRKYRKKKVGTPRLCADDVMARNQLKNYQDSYAQLMNKYGLQRGIDGSEAKHISISEYYKSLIGATENLQSELQTLETNKGQLQSELKEVKRDIKMEKLKSSAVNATTAITDSVSSLFGSNKVKRLEEENKQLKADKTTLEGNISTLKKQMATSEMMHQQQMETIKDEFTRYSISKQEEERKLEELIPYLADLKAIVRECLQMGFATHLIRTISCFKKVSFSGSLYSKQHNRKFTTEQSVAYIKNVIQIETKNKWRLFIDDLPVVDWFKMKYEQWKENNEQNIFQKRHGRIKM
ncbi:MAG: plasmid recombination protein [Solobacterium sp.]|jgi:plasmid recombination enzyme|uniref:MobV family relaxase n=1 Tax=Prevotella melaninogenica TaxID=28132 RepID=UPI001CB15826|nr:MobV family relaxase [Prevotella melaninogenica]MBF1118675.1 plasmid recombination protein [Solobacterium sp.]